MYFWSGHVSHLFKANVDNTWVHVVQANLSRYRYNVLMFVFQFLYVFYLLPHLNMRIFTVFVWCRYPLRCYFCVRFDRFFVIKMPVMTPHSMPVFVYPPAHLWLLLAVHQHVLFGIDDIRTVINYHMHSSYHLLIQMLSLWYDSSVYIRTLSQSCRGALKAPVSC